MAIELSVRSDVTMLMREKRWYISLNLLIRKVISLSDIIVLVVVEGSWRGGGEDVIMLMKEVRRSVCFMVL